MDAIAIVGMACRYPGARSPDELWENILAERQAFRRIPPERLCIDDYVSADRDAPDPQQLVDQSELRDRIADAIAALPEREKLVVALYYYENLTLREIGEVLGVTESRVSQLHTKAVLRLRSKLQGELD